MNQWSFGDSAAAVAATAAWNVQYLGSHSYHLDRSYYNNTPYFPGPGAINPRRPNQLFRPDPHHRQRRDRELQRA